MGEINNLANIQIKGLKKRNPKLSVDGYLLPFYQTKKSLKDLDKYNKFVKKVESMVRKSNEYSAYKKYLINDVGLNHCMVFPNINTDMDKVTIEMHHGPLLTLYDSVCIVTDHYLNNKLPVTSIRICEAILEEHWENNIEVMMLCDLAHKLYHAQKIYINPKQAWGYTPRFIERYKDGIDERMAIIINKNLELAKQYNSIDNSGILDVNMTRWDKGEYDDEDDWKNKPVNPLVKK